VIKIAILADSSPSLEGRGERELIEAGMIRITFIGILVVRRIAVKRTHVTLDEHELLNCLGAQGIP